LKIIEGFEKAKAVLSRQAAVEYSISPSLKKRLKAMFGTESPEQAVRQIIDAVRQRGDTALLDYTQKIDGIELKSLEISRQQVKKAYSEVDAELVSALKLAAERIGRFHLRQKEGICKGFIDGIVGQIVRPLERVGVYVPGGTASYPSTVLMTAVPARVAGVKEVVLTTPPRSNGIVPPLTLVAADIAGVDRIFSVGGAQAIAALAFGTGSIPKVDKVCGPGNIFVMLAKKLVYGAVDIDGLQGPSEVLIIADESANPAYCAADLLAQAEHDPLASAVLVTNSRRLADEVVREVEKQLKALPRHTVVAESLASNGVMAVVSTLDEAIELANLYAPEHLALMVKNAGAYLERLTHAGCICVGEDTTVVLGDYVAGPSHALPTGGTARFSSPLSVADFIKLTNFIAVDKASLKELGAAARALASAEGFEAHARAIEKRLRNNP